MQLIVILLLLFCVIFLISFFCFYFSWNWFDACNILHWTVSVHLTDVASDVLLCFYKRNSQMSRIVATWVVFFRQSNQNKTKIFHPFFILILLFVIIYTMFHLVCFWDFSILWEKWIFFILIFIILLSCFLMCMYYFK